MPKLRKSPPGEKEVLAVWSRVEALMAEKGLNANQFAAALDAGNRTRFASAMTRLRKGESIPGLPFLKAIHEVFGVSGDELLYGAPRSAHAVVSEMASPNLVAFLAERAKSKRPVSPFVEASLKALRNDTGDISMVGWSNTAEHLEMLEKHAGREAKLPNRADQNEDV